MHDMLARPDGVACASSTGRLSAERP